MMKSKIYAFVGTTAAGKTYYSKYLMKRHGMQYIPSITTRPPRKGNLDEYKHVSFDEFESLIAAGEIFEHTLFNGHYYGKSHQDIRDNLSKGHSIYTITADRVRALKAGYPETVVICVTVSEPVIENTKKRLIARGHTKSEIATRLQTIETDTVEIKSLQRDGLIDHLIITVEGDKKPTFSDINKLVR